MSVPRTGTPESPSDAILTLANIITLARLALIPLFLWLALGADNLMAAFWLGFAIGASDWVDGRVARAMNQVSRLGITLDPLFDRIAIAAAAATIVALDLAPWAAVAVVLLRDALLVGAAPFLGARGIARPPVSRLGKWGSGGTMWAFGLFLASGAFPDARHVLRTAAWWILVPAVVASYAAAIGYARTVMTALRTQRRAG